MDPDPSISAAAQVGDKNIAPTTTAAADLITAGQRRVNILWEKTQAIIAVTVCATTLVVASKMCFDKGDVSNTAFQLLSNVFFLVVGTYFQRTNHQRIGGVGAGDTGR